MKYLTYLNPFNILKIPNIRLISLCIALLTAVGSMSYLKGREDGRELEKGFYVDSIVELKNTQQEILEQSIKNKEELLIKQAKAIAEIEVRNETIYSQTIREMVEVPVYTECKHPVGGVSSLNKALNPYSSEDRVQD